MIKLEKNNHENLAGPVFELPKLSLNAKEKKSTSEIFKSLHFFILKTLFQFAALNIVIAERNANCQVKVSAQLVQRNCISENCTSGSPAGF